MLTETWPKWNLVRTRNRRQIHVLTEKETGASEYPTEDFTGLKIGSGAKWISLISKQNYNLHCERFFLKPAIHTEVNYAVRGFFGRRKAVGNILIQDTFGQYFVVMDVQFLRQEKGVPMLIFLREIHKNGLANWIIMCKVVCGKRDQDLKMEDYLSVHNGQQMKAFSYYTQKER